jgi:hypothetical protein
MNDRRMPHQRGTAQRRPEDRTPETTTNSYSGAELLVMAEAAEAPVDVLRALRELAPQARFHYLAELWAPRPEGRRR